MSAPIINPFSSNNKDAEDEYDDDDDEEIEMEI